MLTARGKLGEAGERFAERFLRAQGFLLLARNFRTRFGELDLVMLDGDVVVAIEVKTRQNERFGSPEASVTMAKLRRVYAAFHAYLTLESLLDKPCRVDVVAVTRSSDGFVCQHFPNVS
ncbi:YraN family protein [Patescibacteria group bacterium]|nr:YraN family protein [Patescibacteria group bacterium]